MVKYKASYKILQNHSEVHSEMRGLFLLFANRSDEDDFTSESGDDQLKL